MKRMSKLVIVLVVTTLCAASAARAQEKPNPPDLEALAAKGEVLTNADPLTILLRDQLPDDSTRRGFYIGMGVAEVDTEPGPGKDRIRNSLSLDEQRGFIDAVSFSLMRNRNAKLAATGAGIELSDPTIAAARAGQTSAFYRLGFDIATALFGDRSQGAVGNTILGPGSIKIRDSLSFAGRSGTQAVVGFNDSMTLHLNPPQNWEALAAKGEGLTNADPLAKLLRDQTLTDLVPLTREVGLRERGFYIGMGVAEVDTEPGPGKDKILSSLSSTEAYGFAQAVAYSLMRNRHAKLSAIGAIIAAADPVVSKARDADQSALYKLGFDIATGLFGDPAMGTQGSTMLGPGSLKIRGSLNKPAQRGFDDSAAFHFRRTYRRTSGDVTPPPGSGTQGGALEGARRHDGGAWAGTSGGSGAPVVTKDDHFGAGGAAGRVGDVFHPRNSIKVLVKYNRDLGYKGDTNAFGKVGPTSCDAFLVSVTLGGGGAQQGVLVPISSDFKMEEAGGYYVCSYLISEVPFGQTVGVGVSVMDLDLSASWRGGGAFQPPRGQQRTIIIVSGRDAGFNAQGRAGILTLTEARPRAALSFEMVYAPVASR